MIILKQILTLSQYRPSESSLLTASTLTPALTYSPRITNKPSRRLAATDSMCKHLDFLPATNEKAKKREENINHGATRDQPRNTRFTHAAFVCVSLC